MRIDSSGRLLVGTTTANGSMTVNMGTDKNISFTGGVSEVGSVPCLQATNTAGSSIVSMAFRGTDLRFATGSAQRMLIDSSGRVAIGTTSIDDTATALVVKNSSSGNEHTFLDIVCDTNETARVRFSKDGSNFPGEIKYDSQFNFLSFSANAAERMRIDSSGNVGIGTSSPSRPLNVSGSGNIYAAITSTNANNAGLLFGDSSDDDAGYLIYANSINAMLFGTATNEAMRIDSSGNVLINTISGAAGAGFQTKLAVSGADASIFKTAGQGATSAYPIRAWHDATSGNNLLVAFHTDGFVTRGNIAYNRSTGVVQYNGTSDVRLKTNIVNSASALDTLSQIKVRSFDWIEEGHGKVDYGFIAQELISLVPSAVCEGDNGDEVTDPWMVSNPTLVPLLTKALQEAIAKIETLETKVAALEAG
jgi:hypothetical protein